MSATSSAASMPTVPTLQANPATPDFLGLPQELRDKIYHEIASSLPLQCRPNNSRPATNHEFHERHGLLFVNHQIRDEFKPVLDEKTPDIYIGIDNPPPGFSGASHLLDNPQHQGMMRLQIHITTKDMSFACLSDTLGTVLSFWGPPNWYMMYINVIYTDPTKSRVGIWYGEYAFEVLSFGVLFDVLKTTFTKKTIDEQGIVEVTKEIVVSENDWELDANLPEEEYERMMKSAKDKGRWIEDGKWRDADGPLARYSEADSTAGS